MSRTSLNPNVRRGGVRSWCPAIRAGLFILAACAPDATAQTGPPSTENRPTKEVAAFHDGVADGGGTTPVTPFALRARLLHGSRLAVPVRTAERALATMSSDPVRHPAAAFGLSVAVPGAGQAYNRQWIKAVVAVALETAVITGYVVTRRRGLDREDAFQEFAHRDWSPARYAGWLNDYRSFLMEEIGTPITAPPVDVASSIDYASPDAWTPAERSAVSSMIEQIRAIERQAIHPETGAAFSHQLPDFGDQQYYELIGKYFQFAPGWRDYPDWVAQDGSYTAAIDPELSGPGGSKPNVSDTFFDYARDHADAQDILRTASRISILFIVNHLLAGVDAAVTARLRSNRTSAVNVTPRLEVAYGPDGSPVPRAAVAVRF